MALYHTRHEASAVEIVDIIARVCLEGGIRCDRFDLFTSDDDRHLGLGRMFTIDQICILENNPSSRRSLLAFR